MNTDNFAFHSPYDLFEKTTTDSRLFNRARLIIILNLKMYREQ